MRPLLLLVLAAAAHVRPSATETVIADAVGGPGPEFLTALLHPQSAAEFTDSQWEASPKHWSSRSGGSNFNAGLVDTSPGAVQRFVQSCVSAGKPPLRGGPLQAGLDVTLVKEGKQPRLPGFPDVSPMTIAEGLGYGYSVVLNWVQYRSTPLADLAESFEAALGFRASVNMYHTPSGQVAFAPHYDWNDVIILQLEGAKAWSIHEPAVLLPRSDEKRIQDEELRQTLGKPFMEIVMEEGDMLYIPRGWPHAARNVDGSGGGSSSTHLTVGVHSYVYETVEGWLQRAAARWLATAAPLAKRRSPLRKNLKALEKWMQPLVSVAPEGKGGAGLVVLHAAVRAAANADASLRATAVLASQPLRERFNAARDVLCGGGAPDLGAVAAFRGGNPALGLGGVADFAASLEMGRLTTGLGEALASESSLPFVVEEGKSPHASYAQGVFHGIQSIGNPKGPKVNNLPATQLDLQGSL